ncbi:MAG: hypothetical protein Q8P84_08780, partial [Deltaproteobacteria bacterium]|nr:hypothetical protein [Deltaproteobacteria bacterium]
MNTLPVTFLFSPMGWVDPVTAAAEIEAAFERGEEASIAATLQTVLEGFRCEKIASPDLREAIKYVGANRTIPLRQDWLCRLVQEVDPLQWSLGIYAVNPQTLSGVRFGSVEEMLAYVRKTLGEEGGAPEDMTVTLDVSRRGGEKHVSCTLPPAVLESRTTVSWLATVIKEARSHFPDMEDLSIVFPLNGVTLDYPLHDTWGLVEGLPPDILSQGDEMRVTLRLSPDVKVIYGFFRGGRDLRKYYYDAAYEKWEILELQFDEKPFGVLVHERPHAAGTVEIYVDPHLPPHTRRPLFEIFNQALQTVARRKDLKEVVLIMGTDRDPHQIDATAEVLVKKAFEDIPDYVGKVTLAAVLEGAIYYYPFARKLPNGVSRTGNLFFTTLRDLPIPPHLYLPLPE